ncbi:polycystin-1-like protein 1 [Pleurodeles waltl]|uniref:polycystin-1-like protein 1 n=1 Tax=Pleurodeles waltl TaxID=8319 RepID=UPI003709B968
MGCLWRGVLVLLSWTFRPFPWYTHGLSNGVDWYMGCYSVDLLEESDFGYRSSSGHAVDLSSCSKFCLQKGCGGTFLRNEVDCFCVNTTKMYLFNESLYDIIPSNASLLGSEDPQSPINTPISQSRDCQERCTGPVCLPYGNEVSSLAVFSSDGPYIYNVRVSPMASVVQAGTNFTMDVSGCLASSFEKTLGIQSLTFENFTKIQLIVQWTTENLVRYTTDVQRNGCYTVSLNWMYSTPGRYVILVHVANLISEGELLQSMEVLTPAPGSLEVKVERTAEQTPSCLPFETDATVSLERVFMGIEYSFIASVSTGLQLDFNWFFSDDNVTYHTRTRSLLPGGLFSSTNHTFTREGLYQIGVNVSNPYNWVHRTLHVAVVQKILSNLTITSKDGYVVPTERNLSFEIKLYTTVSHLLQFNITFDIGEMPTHQLSDESRFGTLDYLRLLESYGLQRCQMHFHISLYYRSTGNHTVNVSVAAESKVVTASLLQQVQVFEPITVIFPMPEWKKFVQAGADVVFAVNSTGSHFGSKCHWNITKSDETILTFVESEWNLKFCFIKTGFYFLSVECFNVISASRYQENVDVQEVITSLDISGSRPKYVLLGDSLTLTAVVRQGSNITLKWTFTPGDAPIVSTLLTASYMYTQPGVFFVTVVAQNNVSSAQASLEVIVQDPVGRFVLSVSDIVTVNHPSEISIITTSGTNFSLEVLFNLTLVFYTANCLPSSSVEFMHVFNTIGQVEVLARASNQVSSYTAQANVSVVEELYSVDIEIVNPPVVGEDVILAASLNGHLGQITNLIYHWTVNNWTYASGSPLCSYRCRELGLHEVGLTVTSVVASMASIQKHMLIKQAEVGPRLVHPSNAATGESVPFTLKKAPNEATDAIINFGDGAQEFLSENGCFSINHSYTTSGIYNVDVTLDGNSISSIVVVQEVLKDLCLDGPAAVALSSSLLVPTTVTWNARIGSGSHYLYRWIYSNGTTNATVLGPSELTLKFSTPSIMTVLLRVENEISHLWAKMTTTVEYPISNISISVSPATVSHGSMLEIAVQPQQDYLIAIDFGDGTSLTASSQQLAPVTGCLDGPLPCSVFAFEHSYPALERYNVSAIVSNTVSTLAQTTEVLVQEPVTGIGVTVTTPSVIRLGDYINATVFVESDQDSDLSFQWTLSCSDQSYTTHGSALSIQATEPGTCHVSVSVFSMFSSSPEVHYAPHPVTVRAPLAEVKVSLPFGIDYAPLLCQADGTWATQTLAFSAQATDEADFSFDFGDGSPLVNVSGEVTLKGFGASAYHPYRQEGVYLIKVVAYNEFYSSAHQVGPFYVEIAPDGLIISMNPSKVQKDDIVHFTASLEKGSYVTYTWDMDDQTTYLIQGPDVTHTFSTVRPHNVSVTAKNRVGNCTFWMIVPVICPIKFVSVRTSGTVFATNTDIEFHAVTADQCATEFIWHFGDGSRVGTSSTSFTKRYTEPNRYNVRVNASNSASHFISEVYLITVQRRIVANSLVAKPSVLVNENVTFVCRINSGTSVSYQWTYGDGSVRAGRHISNHIYNREGEFTVKVYIFNNVSSALLTKQIFVVREHCQPPPVKSMGPPRLQVRRYQNLQLGVTFEAAISCNISQGLFYQWSFISSSGARVPLPPSIDTKKQTISLPSYLLEYGLYTAVAKVQIIGNVVYSNYTVHIEVPPSLPVSVIAGGNHLFISKIPATAVALNGSESYDPDYPEAIMRFNWKCAPSSRPHQSCFSNTIQDPFRSSSDAITFQTDLLDSGYDQFLVTLTVSSGNRTSSEAQVFLSVYSSPTLRLTQLICINCDGNSVNWDQEFSVQAVCADCQGRSNLSYSWNMHLINATESSQREVPFCRMVDSMGSSSSYSKATDALLEVPDQSLTSESTANPISHALTATVSVDSIYSNSASPAERSTGIKYLNKTSKPSDSPGFIVKSTVSVPKTESAATFRTSKPAADGSTVLADATTTTSGILDLPYPVPGFLAEGPSRTRHPRNRRSTIGSSTAVTSGGQPISTTTAKDSFNSRLGSSRDALLPSVISEGEVGSSRPGHRPFYEVASRTSGTMERHLSGASSSAGVSVSGGVASDSDRDGGDSLVDPSIDHLHHVVMLMIDWSKHLLHSEVFKSYTTMGTSSHTVTLRSFALKPTKMYMVEVAIASNEILMGRAQLYFSVNEKPHGMTCQVQPRYGFEIESIFSIFCTSGREDLRYEFSYRVGNASRKTLYKGRDIEYYFNLPAGDPDDRFKVTIFIEVTNRFGSKTLPCPVNVTVRPTFLGNVSSTPAPQEHLYFQSLKNLSVLLLMGNHIEIRNYITLITTVLNRLHTEENKTLHDLQCQTRNTFIASVCSLSVQDQEEINDLLLMLYDLMNTTKQISFQSATLVMGRIKELAKLFMTSSKLTLDKHVMSTLTHVISNAMEVSDSLSEKAASLMSEGIKCSTELLLKYVSLHDEPHFHISTKVMEIQTTLHSSFQNIVHGVDSTRFHLSDAVDKQITDRTGSGSMCYISQIINFRRNPYFSRKTNVQIVGDMVDLSFYNCTSRRKINVRGLRSPIKIDFEVKNHNTTNSNCTSYSLIRDKVNIHHFVALPENKQEALQITVEFSKPHTKAFPIMLLARFAQKPTPSNFNMKKIHWWDGETVQMLIPGTSLKGSCYLALLDADYNRKTKNKYLANVVNYTIHVRWTQCLYWDEIQEWKTDGCYPQQSITARTVSCRCDHLTTFTIAKRTLESSFETSEVSQFLSITFNLVPCIVVMLSLALYVVLAIVCKVSDHHEEKKNGYVLLEDNAPSDQQVYAIFIDTGFRSRSKFTAKVHIVLHGEDGVSETRELHCPDKRLFERNSRHMFIMSLPDSLGPIWKIHLWHNNSGHSPSWYISHVIVKDLITGTSWFFPAECWLAVDEGDGKVERELMSMSNGLCFRELLYCRFTEYLEDFHFWGSVYSRPSHSWFTHTQRLTVCLVLLLGYMCLNVWLIHNRTEEYTAEFGLIDISTASMKTGIITTLIFLPVGLLLSLLFRLRKKQWSKDSGEEQYKAARGSQMCSREDHQSSLMDDDITFESYLTWQNFQQWAHEAWKKKYERDSFTPVISSRQHNERSRRESLCSSDRTSSGFEDCSSHDNKPALQESTNDVRADYSSECSSLSGQPVFHIQKVLPQWCNYLAWGFCVLIAAICAVITGTVGLRFGSTKCILWFHALFFSTVFCFCVLQPFVILVVAAVVAWKNRGCSDFFSETLCDATKYMECEPGHLPKHFVLHSCSHFQDTSTELEKILAARQRARCLRLARPPKPAQLKEAKERMRKKALVQQTLREFLMYSAMLLLLILLTFGKFSSDEYLLNHAVKMEFTRNAKNPFTEITTLDQWWNWSFTSLLEGLYWDTWYNKAAAKAQAGPVGGKCFLIGSPIIRQLRVSENASCVVPSQFLTLIRDCRPPYSVAVQALQAVGNVSNQEEGSYYQCGQTQCYEGRGSVVSLGRSRNEAFSRLLNLRKNRWIDRSTRAVIVEFALYNPPTNLFTSVSLLAEIPLFGGVIPSSNVKSVSIYRISTVLDYFIMVSEMAYLGLVLVHCYFQLTTIIQRGLLNYWQEPWNWVEVFIIVLSLCYYAYFVYRLILAVDIIDRLQRGFFRVFVDLSLISSWDQCARSLHGAIVFLMLMKGIRLLRIHKVTAPCVSLLRLSFSSVVLTLVTGIVFMAAYSTLGYLLFMSKSYTFSSIARACKTVLLYFLGVSEMKTFSTFYKLNQVSVACYYGTFFIIMTVLWTGMLKGVLTSFTKEAKKSVRSKHVVALREVTAHTWEKVLSFVGRQRQKSAESVSVHSSNFYLDEFENLIDELLFRLNAFSNSLHHSLPAKSYHYPEMEEDNPSASCSVYSCRQESANPQAEEGHKRPVVGEEVSEDEEELLQNDPEKSDVFSARESSTDSGFATQKALRSCLEFEMGEHLPLQRESQRTSFSATAEYGFSLSRCSNCPSDQKTTLFQSTEELLTAEVFTEAPGLNSSTICTQVDKSPSQESESHAQMCLADALSAVTTGPDSTETPSSQSQRLTNQLRCASAGVSAKSRKPLKRSPTTVIEALDRRNAVPCTAAHTGADAVGSCGADKGPECQHFQCPPLLASIKPFNRAKENLSEIESDQKEDGEQVASGKMDSVVKKISNTKKTTKIINVTAPDERDNDCNGQDLRGFIRQCW